MEVIHTPGHTVGSICLQLENHLFTGDHVLPGYTPNIGGADIEYNGLLGKYIKSLERIASFDRPGLTVLPGHHEPVTELTGHVQKTIAHHEQRESQILNLLAGGGVRTVYEIAIKMFGTMHDFHLVLGTGEVNTHLELLLDKNLVAHEAGQYYAI
jgi:glyoxylase-like metal-dependent hydrolase (beta-lactamase superfamily II)